MPKKKPKELNPTDQIRIIRKSNTLVEARYKFDIWETRVFVKMLTMISPDDIDFHEYKISIGDVMRDFDLSSNGETYQMIKESAKKLLTKVITIERDTAQGIMEFVSPLIAGMDSFKTSQAENYIMVSFHPKMKPYLLELRDRYLVYDVSNIAKLTSVNSIRIYELLKQYEKIGTRTFTLDELKHILGVQPDEYQLYGHFKDKVILKAQRDLAAETDIEFAYHEVKEGRRVVQLVFQIYKNNRLDPPTPIISLAEGQEMEEAAKAHDLPLDDASSTDRLFEQVGAHVSRATVAEWLATYSLEQVQSAIQYTLGQLARGERIRSVGAYLTKMVKAGPPTAQPTKARSRPKTPAPMGTGREELEATISQLRKERYDKAWQMVEQLMAADPSLGGELCQGIAGTLFGAYYKPDRSFAENLQSAMFKAYVLDEVQRRFPSHFGGLAWYEPRIAQLEAQKAHAL